MKKYISLILVVLMCGIVYAANNAPSTGIPELVQGIGLQCNPKGDSDLESNDIYHIYDFRKNGQSLAVLNMPFGNSAKDYSTYGNNGVVNNVGYYPTDGPDGSGAYYFNARDAEIVVPNSASLVFDPARQYSWEFWILPAELNRDQKIISKQASHVGGYDIRLSSENRIEFVSAHDYTNYLIASAVLNEGQWYHVVVTFDNNSVKVYINGVEQVLTDFSVIWNGYASTFRIDNINDLRMSAASEEVLHAMLDSVRIYDRVLSNAEILDNYGMNYKNLVSNELSAGTWTCAVTANDWFLDSNTMTSNGIVIV